LIDLIPFLKPGRFATLDAVLDHYEHGRWANRDQMSTGLPRLAPRLCTCRRSMARRIFACA
jgi:hypothetical protein